MVPLLRRVRQLPLARGNDLAGVTVLFTAGVSSYENRVRRFVIFLGLFSLLLLGLLAVSAMLVQKGVVRTTGHWALGWAAVLPMSAYVVLSLRELVRRP